MVEGHAGVLLMGYLFNFHALTEGDDISLAAFQVDLPGLTVFGAQGIQ